MLRQAGWPVNHKRVAQLYAEQGLQVRRRQRKKVPIADRQPLASPERANEVWLIDFLFDRIADGRPIKCLAIVDDATHEGVTLEPAFAMGGQQLTPVLDQLAMSRGLPRVIRSDNGQELFGKAMHRWAYGNGVQLKPIEPGKPNQNATIESFNGRFQDECLNEHWFIHMAHAKAIIKGWRRVTNVKRPRKHFPSIRLQRMPGKSQRIRVI